MKGKSTTLLYAVALVSCALTMFPPIWALYVSVSVNVDGRSRFGFDHFAEVTADPQFWLSMWNSFAAASLSTAVSIVLGVMAAYGMTRFKVNYDRLALFVLAMRMMPSIVLIIPFYILYRQIGFLDNVVGLAVTYLTFSLPFAVWMIRGFFAAIPHEIDEAATLDGANAWATLRLVILPLSLAPILTTAVLIFCFCWNEFLFALVLTDSHALTFLPMLTRYVPPQGPLYGQIFAGSTIYFAIPIVALTLIRRHLEGSFASGSLK
ncbi:carbohydrate ABC transporter permease [Mesorhizobium sp. B3-1-3]|uniref:carbohydrate ABC transporter permease n=1 Tax=unclassified Mesorhizobium TaxID=325217 RepID=UPI00112DB1E4|nr:MULTISPECIES: carbohydrate ABC transporter permease [unclassified Mesorhizobium]TPI67219.1 carbohydrate ABC transporter permease [Mesorhizobium sp. B3-1-8]TPI70448.1 carbohydrate ABC transporter permease [Mesorhizobium sp. B3-1-3]